MENTKNIYFALKIVVWLIGEIIEMKTGFGTLGSAFYCKMKRKNYSVKCVTAMKLVACEINFEFMCQVICDRIGFQEYFLN